MALKELIFLPVSTLGGCGGLEITHFNSFYIGIIILRPPHLTKLETVKNHFFQGHHVPQI